MNRKVKLYSYSELDIENISKVLVIKKFVMPLESYNKYYSSIDSVLKFIQLYYDNPEDISLVIGEDWFLLYAFDGDNVWILDWASINNKETKVSQSLEMYSFFKILFKEFYDKQFCACMKEETSYPFYLKLLNDGYILERKNILIKSKKTIKNDRNDNNYLIEFIFSDKFKEKYVYRKTLKKKQ